MPISELELNQEGAQEHLYTLSYACGIMDAASAENMAWIHDTVINTAKAYDIDLAETDDHAKAKAAYKKAFQEDLAARGILIKSNIVGGYVLNNDPQKRKEFALLIHSVRCQKENLEFGKAALKIAARAVKAKEGTLSFIAKELELGPKAVQVIGIATIGAIAIIQDLSKKLDDTLTNVKSHIARDILKMDDYESVKFIFGNQEKENELLNKGKNKTEHGPEDVLSEFGFGSQLLKNAIKEKNDFVQKRMKIEGPTTVDAYLSDKYKEKLLNKAKRKFEGEKKEEISVADRCVEFVKNKDLVILNAGIMMDAYLEIDKDVNPDGRATFNMEHMYIDARSFSTKIHCVIPYIISIAAGTNELVKDMSFGNASRLHLSLSSIIHKGYNSKSPDVQVVSKFANQLLYGVDTVASFLGKNIIPVGDFTKAEYDIRHFNIKEIDERKRGENYAKTYASLNIYRAGKAEYIVGAFSIFDMRPKDCLWAMAYLTAGINVTKNGVIYDIPKDGKIGNKQEITENHDKNLDKKALAIYEKYENLAVRIGYEASLQKMKEEFITLHHTAIDKSKKMREQMGLDPLSEHFHFNRIYDNAPVKEFDYIRVKTVTKNEYQKNDLNKLFEEYDAIYIRDDYTGSLQINGEKRVVVASLDEQNRAVSMACTPEILDLDSKEHNAIEKKEETIEVIEDTKRVLLKNDALTIYRGTFENKEVGERAVNEWRTITKDLFETDNYVSFYNAVTKECGIKDKRTGVELNYKNCDPKIMLNDQCVSIKQFALDVLKEEREKICKTQGVNEQEIRDVIEIADRLTPITSHILARVDKENCIEDLDTTLKLLSGNLNVEDTLVNIDKRRAVVAHMTELVKEFDKAEAIIDNLKAEIEKYNELSKTDHVLALFRTVEPRCEREGAYITLNLPDGTKFAMTQNGKLAEFCDELDKNICDLRYTFTQLLIEGRDNGIDISAMPIEQRDTREEPELDTDEMER